MIAVVAALAAGCTQSPSLTDPQVFVGRLGQDVSYQPFKNTLGSNATPDATVCFPDTSIYCPDAGATLRVVVPGPGDPNNFFAGGTLVSGVPRNLSGYDAVTFWAKSTRDGVPLVIGLGADQSDNPLYLASRGVILSTGWTQYVLPIPQPAVLTSEKGLFFFSAGAVGNPGTGYTFWIANVQYVALGTSIGGPGPLLPPACVQKAVGDAPFPAFPGWASDQIPVAFGVNAGTDVVNGSSRYFAFGSSDPAVATIGVDGKVQVNGQGTATITARLGGIEGAGPLTVKVGTKEPCPTALPQPTVAAAAPTVPAEKVISVYNSSNTYTNVKGTTKWDFVTAPDTIYNEFKIPGTTSTVKKYFLSSYAVIQFGTEIDASEMTFLHLDVWTPNGFVFQVQLNNAVLQPSPPAFVTQSTLQVDAGTTPALETGRWVGLEIPMSTFRTYSISGPSFQPPPPQNPWTTPLGSTSQLGQLTVQVPGGISGTFYLDNIYFHN
jgi:hypothetical protein